MPKIDLLFGNLLDEKSQDNLERWAIEWDHSIELLLIQDFHRLLMGLLRREKEGQHFFDLIFLIIAGESVKAPRFKAGSHLHNSFRLPMLTMSHDYLIHSDTKERIFITDDMINALGSEYEEHFYYQYLGFKRH
jgi:hypothetical protein